MWLISDRGLIPADTLPHTAVIMYLRSDYIPPTFPLPAESPAQIQRFSDELCFRSDPKECEWAPNSRRSPINEQ